MNAFFELSQKLALSQLELLQVPDPLEFFIHQVAPTKDSPLFDVTVHHIAAAAP